LTHRLTKGQPRSPADLALFLHTAWQLLQTDGGEDRVLQVLADRGSSSSSNADSSGGGGGGGLLLLQEVAQSTKAGADCRLQASVSNMQQVRTNAGGCQPVGNSSCSGGCSCHTVGH
jgi:hypothetical protein